MGKRKCVVANCHSEAGRSEDVGVSFHKIPQHAIVRLKWLEVCQVKLSDDDKKFYYVCSRHFLRADFCKYNGTKYLLRTGALPSIFPWSKRAPKRKSQSTSKDKRSRKSKCKPVHVTNDMDDGNLKKKGGSDKEAISEEENEADMDSSDKEEEVVIESEDSTSESRDLPPILEPEDLQSPKTGFDTDKIPELEPSACVLPSDADEKPIGDKKVKGRRSSDKMATVRKETEEKISTIKEKLTAQEKDSIIKDKIVVEDKCKPSEIKSLRTKNEKAKTDFAHIIESNPVAMKPSDEVANKIESRTVSPSRPTTIEQKIQTVQLTFEPNMRIEALDFNQAWSPATIMEVDYEENEVLVHFDLYSNKYDEWIGISSSSIRAPCLNTSEPKPEPAAKDEPYDGVKYEIGERCLAYWIDAKKFPVTVKEILNQETYVVEFDDGYIKTLNASKMVKLSLQKRSMQNSPLFLPIKGTKEDRRKRKRKLNVQALFKKRIRTKSTSLDSSLIDDGSSADETPMTSSVSPSGFYESDLWYPNFENGYPVGKHSKLKTKVGIKDTIIVPDPRLPAGWEKHIMRREIGKWFCVVITSDGKRLRCRADFVRYMNDNPSCNYDDYVIDFNVAPRRARNGSIQVAPLKDTKSHLNEKLTESDHVAPSPTPIKSEPQLKILQVDGGFQCPIDGCGKNFRRENLVQMHVKHYHPEFKKYLESTPNVLDLVYQRLHGDDFELSPGRSSTSDYSKRTSYTPEDISNANDTSLFEQQKDAELKKLLNTSPYDAVTSETTGSQTSMASNSFADIKLRDLLNSGESGDSPDLKSLAVTTKKGLKTIPAVKKQQSEEYVDVDVSGKDGNRKRKLDELIGDEFDSSGSGLLVGDLEFPLLPPPNLDHIINEDGKVIKIEHMRKEEIINCTCGITEEDGLMIQCEICMCWQHAHCNNIYRETEVPEKYICYICQHPLRQRNSKKFMHDQDWLKHGTLPTASYHCKDDEANQTRFDQLKASHDISGGLLELKDYMNSLKLKMNIAELKNHPKLYLWSKQWENAPLPERRHSIKNDSENLLVPKDEKKDDLDLNSLFATKTTMNIPQPEAAIETADCRLHLLEHIAHCQSLIEQRLADFEKKIDELDSHPNVDDEKDANRVRLTTSMLVRDLSTLKELSQFSTF